MAKQPTDKACAIIDPEANKIKMNADTGELAIFEDRVYAEMCLPLCPPGSEIVEVDITRFKGEDNE